MCSYLFASIKTDSQFGALNPAGRRRAQTGAWISAADAVTRERQTGSTNTAMVVGRLGGVEGAGGKCAARHSANATVRGRRRTHRGNICERRVKRCATPAMAQ